MSILNRDASKRELRAAVAKLEAKLAARAQRVPGEGDAFEDRLVGVLRRQYPEVGAPVTAVNRVLRALDDIGAVVLAAVPPETPKEQE